MLNRVKNKNRDFRYEQKAEESEQGCSNEENCSANICCCGAPEK